MIKGVSRGAAAAALAIVVGGGAFAGEIADKAAEAEARLQSGATAGAVAAFDAATEAFWAATPLSFRAALFADDIRGFARYTARADSAFKSGDTATIYIEPVGYGFTETDDGYEVSFTTGLEIRQGDIVLGKVDNFGAFTWQGRSKSFAVSVPVSVALPALKPGDYQLLVTLTDTVSSKTRTATLPFSIAE